jgi:RNA polymerase sigma-70 factor (ECF subfamily)
MTDWNGILEEHGPMVWRIAYRLLGRADEAQECLQETFLSALRVVQRDGVKSWGSLLRHLATARALDQLRSRIRRQQHEGNGAALDTAADHRADPVQIAQEAELASRLRDALGQLPPREGEVFALRFFEQMRYREIGKVLGLRSNAVGVLLHQARERLRGLLAEPDRT